MTGNQCSGGFNRGNKLYEGHRMILPEHKEAILNRKRAEYQLPEPVVSQADEEKNSIITTAIQQKLPIKICWKESVNPLKLDAEEYARYLHGSLRPGSVSNDQVLHSVGIIAGYLQQPPALKCKLECGNKLVAIADVISVSFF